jgi:hypothetical protein
MVYLKVNLYTEITNLKLVKIEGCDYVCPLEEFFKLTDKKILKENFNQECVF